MAEAIAAFSLAANIVQFIDFGSRVATNMRGIYRSTGNGLLDVNRINSELQLVLKHLHEGPTKPSATDSCLAQLASDCRSTAIELDTKLKPLLKARSQVHVDKNI